MGDIKEKFEVLEGLPVLVCLLKIADKTVLYANKSAKIALGENITGELFPNIFEISRDLEDIIEKIRNNIDSNDIVKSFAQLKNGKKFILFFNEYKMETESGNEDALIVTAVDIATIKRDSGLVSRNKNDIYNKSDGLDFLENCLHDVENDETNYFSATYVYIPNTDELVKGNDDSAKKDHITELVSVIKSSIRVTDMFCNMEEDTEFLMISPKCKHGIMSKILTAIENKLEIINNTKDRKNKLKISYSVMEISKKNMDSPENIVKKVRDIII